VVGRIDLREEQYHAWKCSDGCELARRRLVRGEGVGQRSMTTPEVSLMTKPPRTVGRHEIAVAPRKKRDVA
jgi:hypothetical protein